MIVRLLLVTSMLVWLSACGTKSELDLPNGKPNPKGEIDPSLPPHPITR
jgi:hypothetical protein